MDEILKFEDIHFTRKGRKILTGVDWTIRKGQQWALLGPNGSGKSTLLGMIPAYTYASKGSVRVLGHKFGKVHWDKVRRDLGYVSSTMDQFTRALKPESVIDIIRSGVYNTFGFYKEIGQDEEERAHEMAQIFGLSHIKDNTFSALSQGEQRRTLIARAFMNDPKLMVLDEPCTGLDLRGKEDLLSNLKEYCDIDKKPLIYVTHNIDEIIEPISHVAIMDGGNISIKGPKEEVLTEENLSGLYGLDIEIDKKYGRYWIKVRS